MIYGIGCDLCAIQRTEKSLRGAHGATFAKRVYGDAEQAALQLPWLQPPTKTQRQSAAANFAAKEAFLKAAGRGLGGFDLADVQALRRKSGAPYYVLSGSAAAWMEENGLIAYLTLTHEGDTAMAVCLLEKR